MSFGLSISGHFAAAACKTKELKILIQELYLISMKYSSELESWTFGFLNFFITALEIHEMLEQSTKKCVNSLNLTNTLKLYTDIQV